ncbi:protein Wnt-1-like [Daktulosphaira vitifoliae]|uniref:protein Wnt-1-like n=1 Tax=Daktulosphaira vitifoliae TaxID=58002 RepID=UPI0021AAD16A|nr:protein Wnt-1-like [Daktulosphaira vitifoliae]
MMPNIKIFLIVILFSFSKANWWYLGLQNYPPKEYNPLLSHKENCYRYNFLKNRQQQLCDLGEKIMSVVSSGTKMAIEECQHQFGSQRWNCTTYLNNTSVFGNVMMYRSREKAYVNAITAAGVAYAITKACSRGELNECSCDNRIKKSQTQKNWQWGGCSEDIHFGEKFSRDFVDSIEDTDNVHGLMNVHNNEAGRRIIRSSMQKVCKCHGMSGSCSVRICWMRLSSFRDIGDTLMVRYEGASHVRLGEKKRKKIKKLRPIRMDRKMPNKTELVYLDSSPDYCEHNESMSLMGTYDRVCQGLDGCRHLCCHRGFQIRLRDVEEKCKCKFIWCCNVVCEVCKFKKEEYICN